VFVIETPGGGGFGAVEQRAPEALDLTGSRLRAADRPDHTRGGGENRCRDEGVRRAYLGM
jgi:hypothetical protein